MVCPSGTSTFGRQASKRQQDCQGYFTSIFFVHFFNKILKSESRISIELVHDLTCQANKNWGGFLNLLRTVISYLFFSSFLPADSFSNETEHEKKLQHSDRNERSSLLKKKENSRKKMSIVHSRQEAGYANCETC